MLWRELHSWDCSLTQATQLQRDLSRAVVLDRPIASCRHIASVDVSFDLGESLLHAAAIVFDAENQCVVERVSASMKVDFPYIPGYLSFRELPPILKALSKVKTPCQAVLADGQGIAHPRGFGLASHLGLWLNLPTIGCAKSPLFGLCKEPGLERGDRSPLFSEDQSRVIGAALRTRFNVKPLFISVGHLCDLDSALHLILKLSGKTRMPTPSHLAHHLANQIRKAAKGRGGCMDFTHHCSVR